MSLGGAALNLSLVNSFTPTAGETFTLIDNATGSAISGTFNGLAEGAFFPANGALWQISYSGGGNHQDVTLTATTPGLTGASYDAATGQLTLTGDDLTTSASDYNLADLTLTGEGGNPYNSASYALTSPVSIVGTATSTSVTFQLSGQDLIQLPGRLDLNGGTALDATSYTLSTSSGWDTSTATAQSGVAATAAGVYGNHSGDYIGTAGDVEQLNALIVAADSAASGSFEIDFSGDIAVSSALEAINLKSGVTLEIDGEGLALDGKDDSTSASYDQRGLFVYSGAVNIDNLTIENMVANGGSGGAGGGGGGGAGLGGGLFVADNAAADGGTDPNAVASQVSLDDVTFELDSATGGAGGAAAAAAAGAVWAAPQEALVSMAGAALAAPAADSAPKGRAALCGALLAGEMAVRWAARRAAAAAAGA